MPSAKTISAALLCVYMVSLLVLPASAHHGQGGHHGRSAAVAVCTVDGCTLTGRHTHNGISYCGYAHESGFCDNSCCALCTVEGCTETGRHSHDGISYCGYAHESGFCDNSCCALCTVEGCTLTGRHTHDGISYCGANHAAGFCEDNCIPRQKYGCRAHCW